jgi:hypothetical protein
VLPADLIFGAPRLTFESIAEAEATRLEDVDILEEHLNVVIQSARSSNSEALPRQGSVAPILRNRVPSAPPGADG